MIQLLTVLCPCLYLGLALLHAADFGSAGSLRHKTMERVVLGGALLAQVGLLASRFQEAGGVPALGGFVSLSALSLTVALMHVSLGNRSGENASGGTGMVVFGMVFGLQLLSSGFAPLDAGVPSDRPGAFYLLHVASILVASSALILSGAHGVLYLLLFRHMRKRQFGRWLDGLPSLGELARRMRRAAGIAFCFLAVGINGGIWWAHRANVQGFTYSDPLVIVLLVLTLHFGLVSFSRAIPGLTARRTATGAVGGMLLLLVSLAYSLVPGGFHWTS